jgi:hypothetical protein
MWDYCRLRSGKHALRIRAWDGKANPPRTTLYRFDVGETEQSIAIAAYLLLLGSPVALGLFWIGKRQAARRAVRRGFNPYQVGPPVGPDLFTGRADLLKEVMDALANHSVLLTAEQRSGKTSFLHALERRLTQIDEPSWRWVPCYASLEGVPEDRFFTTLARQLFQAVCNELPAGVTLRYTADAFPDSSSYGLRPFIRDLESVADALDAAGKKKVRVVFLIDEIDAMNAYSEKIKIELRSLF